MKKKSIITIAICLFVLLGSSVIAAMLMAHQTKQQVIQTSSKKTNPTSASQEKTLSGATPGGTTDAKNPAPNVSASGASLTTPGGNFVSNHQVSLSSAEPKGIEQSTCLTIAGASCTITFTSNGITKSLPTKQADAQGVVSWQWRPRDIGLSTGSWSIDATVNLDTQIKSAADTLNLEVVQ